VSTVPAADYDAASCASGAAKLRDGRSIRRWARWIRPNVHLINDADAIVHSDRIIDAVEAVIAMAWIN